VSGLATTTIVNPADVLKTRIMNSNVGSAQTGIMQIARDGMLMRGWTANYVRLGPHILITMLVYEQLRATAGWEPSI
jgi:hypothetical protein